MISIDTNILFPACDRSAAFHEMAVRFLSGISRHQGVCICEQVLIELYGLLRNPTVNRHPLSAVKAHETIQTF
ncbi:MAG: VapC toxin family PIN domain ribonuclease, partial [Kiritimatiellia bacterium]